MQPSQKAIEREFEALRDIRRRSSSQGGPGSLLLDPDLPAEQLTTAPPPLSPQAWAANDATSAKSPPPSGHEAEDGTGNSVLDDPFHLFWVPAHLHPELAPSEFRAFLKEHARQAPADGSTGTNLGTALGRASSASSELGRKRSMLSRQYKPRENDGVEEEEKVVPLRRNNSTFGREGPQLTISDLQKLEELADEASKSEDPTKLRRVLRRSLTLNVAPSFLDQMDDVPDTTDDADAPIIVPPRNQILRRTARTKIRKPNLSGDGGGHRFATTRRKSAGRTNSVDQVTSPTDGSSSSHGHGEVELTPPVPIPPVPMPPSVARKRTLETEETDNRRFTYTDEASIFDAYAESPEDEKSPSSPPAQPAARLVVEAPVVEPISTPAAAPTPSRPSMSGSIISSPEAPASQPQVNSAPAPVIYHPQPQRLMQPQQQQAIQQPSRSPSPEASSSAQEIQRPESRSSIKSEAHSVQSISSTTNDKRKEKDKKSLWRKVGGSSDKSSKKGAKDKDKEKEKDKESRFFGSLFGGGKKKHEESPPSNLGGGAGPATAAALLGASKSNNKAYSPSISPQLGNPYARYPIHVERAVYRLSHIKLANPRRPLYEQVLISNLMFWYLGVINKSNQGPGQNQNQNQSQNQNNSQQTQNQAQGNGGAQGGQHQGGTAGHDGAQMTQPMGSEKDQLEREREQREAEERERAEKERIEVERRPEQQQQRREPRRGSLTKPPPAGGLGGRRSEIPVKGPQYHLQSRVIEQEYGGGSSGPSPVTRTSSAPPPTISQQQSYNLNGGYSPSRTQSIQPMKSQQSQQQMYSQPNGNANYYYGRSASIDFTPSGASAGSSMTNLPPGAMAPTDPTWLASAQVVGGTLPTRVQQQSHGYSQSADYTYGQTSSRSSRSPPGNNGMNSTYDWNPNGELPTGGKTPSRSLSANAAAPGAPQSRHYDQYAQYGQHGQHQSMSQNGSTGLKKKPASASAVAPERERRQQRTSDDEDVPLAMWQAQHRK